MFHSVQRVVYPVADLAAAKQWYQKVLEREPSFESPFAVHFQIGDSGLALIPKAHPTAAPNEGIMAFWGVEDTDAAYQRLLELGATSHITVTMVSGTKRAAVMDPFGNIVGIIGKPIAGAKRTVEQQPSETAMGVATMRAFAALEEREEIRGGDHLAQYFLPEDRRRAVSDPALRQWVMKTYVRAGLYEYLIARTAYFDQIVQHALGENIPQIVFLGAGYDSRPYRFKDLIRATRIFELDMQPTQQRKQELLQQADIAIPPQVTFVAINFNTEKIKDVLVAAGYNPGQKTLFVWEGVTFYLLASAVDDTLQFIASNSAAGSQVCFDFYPLSTEGAIGSYRKESDIIRQTHNPGEPVRFGIAAGEIGAFLHGRGFQIIDHLTAEEMTKRYLTLRDGSLFGEIPDRYCIVQAEVMG